MSILSFERFLWVAPETHVEHRFTGDVDLSLLHGVVTVGKHVHQFTEYLGTPCLELRYGDPLVVHLTDQSEFHGVEILATHGSEETGNGAEFTAGGNTAWNQGLNDVLDQVILALTHAGDNGDVNHVLLTERTETVEHHGFLDSVGSVNVSPDGIVGTQRIDRLDADFFALADEATELRLGHLTDLVVLLGFDVLNHENLLALMDLV